MVKRIPIWVTPPQARELHRAISVRHMELQHGDREGNPAVADRAWTAVIKALMDAKEEV